MPPIVTPTSIKGPVQFTSSQLIGLHSDEAGGLKFKYIFVSSINPTFIDCLVRDRQPNICMDRSNIYFILLKDSYIINVYACIH